MNDNYPSAQPDDGSKKTAEPSSATASPAVTRETASLRESDSPRSPRSLNLFPIPSRVPRQKKRSSSLQKQLQEVLRSSLGGTQPTEQSPEANVPNPAIPPSALSAAPRENSPAPEQADSPESSTAPTSEFSPAKSDGSSQGLAEARPSLEMKEPLQIPARMLNEFVYCQRLFFYEFVEGVFVENADTLRGSALHQRVDSGTGAMPKARKKAENGKAAATKKAAPSPSSPDEEQAGIGSRKGEIGKQEGASSPVLRTPSPPHETHEAGERGSRGGDAAIAQKRCSHDPHEAGASGSSNAEVAMSPDTAPSPIDPATSPQPSPQSSQSGEGVGQPETIHSRSVQMGSERLGVSAKMDLVEVRIQTATGETGELFNTVCPVDYKAGSPREGEEGNQLWDTDKIQLGLQALILRDNGYTCDEGIIYYRATRQRVRLSITQELEAWIIKTISDARRVATGPIPGPLINSPKCVRCSLAPVCLPDETRLLALPKIVGDEVTRLISNPDTQNPNSEFNQSLLTSSPTKTTPPRRLIAARDDNRALYLNTQGFRVGCSDEVLVVKDKDKTVEEVRMRDVSHVALFGNIQISTQAIQSLCQMEIPVTYFSMGGWFYGITRGHEMKNVFLRMEQFRLARDPATCLALARQFVQGKIKNHRTMLMRNHLEPPAPAILKLKRAAEDATQAGSLEELLGIEGAAASLYFQNFNGMIKVADDLNALDDTHGVPDKQLAFNFSFAGRNRRPPTDPVNAMLSLAYSLLSKDCTLAASAVGFDPYVGFYHQPRFGRPAMGLDLMEEFRPLIAESTVLSCINNRVITEKDFVRAGQAVNLSAAGRKRFFQTYEQRMTSLLTHPLFEYKVSYRRALELQARILAKALTGEIPEYLPLQTR